MRCLSALLLLLLCAGTYLAVRFVQQSPRAIPLTTAGVPALPPNINLRLTGVSITGRKNGRPAWTMKSNRMDTTRDHNEIDFSGNVQAAFLQEGKTRATIHAETAHYSNSQKLLTASGPVICLVKPAKSETGEDLQIQTDQVVWNIGARQVSCPGTVRATLGKRNAQGEQFTVDLKTRNISLRNAVVSLPVEEDGTLPKSPKMEKIIP